MRQKFHSLTLVLIALFMMLLSFASCSKLQDMLNEGNEDGYMSVTFYSAQKKALISLEYDPEVPGATDQTTWEEVDAYAPIYMMVLEGVSEDFLRAMLEEDTRSSRVGARQQLHQVLKCKFDVLKNKKKRPKICSFTVNYLYLQGNC